MHDHDDEICDVLSEWDAEMQRGDLHPRGERFGGALEIEERTEERHADGAERNQSIFNFPAGKIASGETAEADADSHRGLQVADVRVVNVQHVVAIHDDRKLQQRREEPEITVAENGPAEDAVSANGSHLRGEICEWIPAELFRGVGGGHARDSETGGEAEESAAEEYDSGHGFVIAIVFGEEAGGHYGADAADERAEFDDPVAPGKAALRQDFRQQAVFRGAEERGLRADQKYGGTFQRQILQPQAQDSDAHYENFHQLGADHDAAFAVTVGEVAAGEREENKGEREECANDEDEEIALVLSEVHRDDEVNDEEFYGVVVEGVLKLGDDQAPEAETPRGLRG